jgi:predicted acetyltransferase
VRRIFPNDWSLAAFEDGEMTAWLRMIPLAMRINGHGLSFAGVGPVVSLPQHRRKGHVGALLREALAVMRDRGQVLSGLHTPHPALYRRYGWEIASYRRTFMFNPKDTALRAQPSERGRVRLLQPDDWPQADRVYRQYASMRNGPIHRGDVWWREAIFGRGGEVGVPGDVALWEDGQGNGQGYVLYHQRRGPGGSDWPAFLVRELVALTRDAYLNLLLFLLRHDLAEEITYATSQDDPFLSVIEEAQRVRVRDDYDVMLRVCDIEAALQQRAFVGKEPVELTLGVEDTAAPWNGGTYRVVAGESGVDVERVGQEPDISMTAAVFASVFNGFLSTRTAALAGLVNARDEGAIERADRFFATLYQPFCADGF